jgi:hypothetical protein
VIQHTPNGSLSDSESDAAIRMFNELWWPYRTLSQALLQTQRNATGYLEANRRLLGTLRHIIRKEQDLAAEISESLLKAMSPSGNPNCARMIFDPNRVNEIFNRATSGMRELSQVWIEAQTHSLNTMRLCGQNGDEVEIPVQIDAQAEQSGPQRHVTEAAPEPIIAAVQEKTSEPDATTLAAESLSSRKQRAGSRRSSTHSALSTPSPT